MQTKICTECVEEKSVNEYVKSLKGRLGKAAKCKSCQKKWREKNQYFIKESYGKNKHKYKKQKKEYYRENKKKIQARNQQWRKENRDENNEYKKRWRLERIKNPDYKFRENLKSLFREKVKSKNDEIKSQLFDFIDIDEKMYIENIKKSKHWKSYSKDKYIEIDHIIPLSAYNLDDLREIKKCWNPDNLRLLTKKENRYKHDKIDIALIKKLNIQHLLPKN